MRWPEAAEYFGRQNEPQTFDDITGGNVTEVMQENLFDLFTPSLQCFASRVGSYLYSVYVFDGEYSNNWGVIEIRQ